MQVEYWSGFGGERWAASQRQLDTMLSPFARAILDRVKAKPGDKLVDVGCGCGATALAAARLGSEVDVTAVDISSPMLEVARRRASEEALDIRFIEADAAAAAIGDGDVDWIISRFGMMFFDDPGAAFRNLCSWLKPTGTLVTTLWGELGDNVWARGLGEIARRHVEVPDPPPGSPGPFSLSDRGHVEGLLRTAGFVHVGQEPLDIPMRVEGTVDIATQLFQEVGPIGRVLEEVDDPQTIEQVVADLQAFVVGNHDGTATTLPAAARLVIATR